MCQNRIIIVVCKILCAWDGCVRHVANNRRVVSLPFRVADGRAAGGVVFPGWRLSVFQDISDTRRRWNVGRAARLCSVCFCGG